MATKNIVKAARSEAFNLFKEPEADWAFRRTLEYMVEHAAEIGECLYAARRIDESDHESWRKEWTSLAERVENFGDESLRNNKFVSAREAYLRASNYYRNAEYGTLPDHPQFHQLWEKSRQVFHKACRLFDPPIQVVEIPFEGKILPGYFWRPDDSNQKRPTLVAVGGNDSSGEEVFFNNGPAAIRRGYNYFTFEFPGHRGAVHLDPTCIKRYDYEVPFKAAFDFLEKQKGVDERIALNGFSFGGYVVSRAAIFEKRVAALIPNSPIIDSYAVTMQFWGGIISKIPLKLLAKMSEKKLAKSPIAKALKAYTDWTGGVYKTEMSIEEKFNHNIAFLKQMNITEQIKDITCPTLALVSDGDGEELIRQAKQFVNSIGSSRKDFYQFSMEKDGSEEHCQLDNRARSNQVMFDWLDNIFDHTQ